MMSIELGDIVRIRPESVTDHYIVRQQQHGEAPVRFPLSHPLFQWLGTVIETHNCGVQVEWFHAPEVASRGGTTMLNEDQEVDDIRLYEVRTGC